MSVLFSATRTLTQGEFNAFARISGDDNPIHVDPDFAARTRFGRTVAHGMMLYSVLWTLVQRHRPGARHRAQSLMFPSPAFADETLVFEGRVRDGDDATIVLTVRRARDGEAVCEAMCQVGDTVAPQ
jgi:acyl dehydratase